MAVPQDLIDIFPDKSPAELLVAFQGSRGATVEERTSNAIDILYGLIPPSNAKYPSPPPVKVERKMFALPLPPPPINARAGPSVPARKKKLPAEGGAKAKGKGKGKGKERLPQQVISLSDEDDEVEFVVPKSSQGSSSSSQSRPNLPLAAAGPSQANKPVGHPSSPPDHSKMPSPPSEPKPLLPSQAAAVAAASEQSIIDTSLTQCLLLLSDCLPSHARRILSALSARGIPSSALVETCIGEILDATEPYPKAEGTAAGKRKRDGGGDDDDDEGGEAGDGKGNKRAKGEIDFESVDRVGSSGNLAYQAAAYERLYSDFPLIPIPHVKKNFGRTGGLYVPTFLELEKESKLAVKPYKEKKVQSKGKGRAVVTTSPEFEAELAWLLEKQRQEQEVQEAAEAEERLQKEAEENGTGIECGCCFGTYPFERCVQCEEGHLFCMECVNGHAKNLLGSQKIEILCMDTDGCKAAFPESELKRALPEKLLGLMHRLVQEKYITDAGLEGLESCPFCNFYICIENPDEKLFRCQSDKCGIVSCRKCKKLDHIPKTCEEMAKDAKLDHRHFVEEEMTKALIRICPNKACNTPMLKEAGCNKMMCSKCRTLSCYICSAIIKGYDHFDQTPGAYHLPKQVAKCALWDDSAAREAKAVADAAEKAKAEVKARGADVDDKDLDVELPPPPPPNPPAVGPARIAQQAIQPALAARLPAQPGPYRDPARPVHQLDGVLGIGEMQGMLEAEREARDWMYGEAGW